MRNTKEDDDKRKKIAKKLVLNEIENETITNDKEKAKKTEWREREMS